MDWMLLVKSVALGIAIAAPLGPIGALCINRTLERGFAAGLAGGLGTALADGTYALLAALGFAAFSGALGMVDLPLRLLGGAFMLWLGWTSLRPKPMRAAADVPARDLVGVTVATFVLTIANPMTIVSFAALFAGLGLASADGLGPVAMVVGGVFAGSMLWWCLLSGGVALLRQRLPTDFAAIISRLSGLVMIGFGLWAVVSAVASTLGR
ncbi:LysE family transporter [Devosia sp. 63-57]|uniref:LysE family translocator n=1 Tax=Devosia sp. 63-57 TaxID=1895751 RepID=UPI000868E4D4|nr:LysE family transporter [Devosia sp. 63-57]ODT50935.1 MAG: lysine transporter LysE [Pelagibacterium sp. SCN 63-126]ODU85665.1 MAG: lysine transporter LysE [Pelagibacterium sp. SCN 63-17]OJX44405.1 MAG: lysine transporter LysE [Devosia sp. 63-57]